MCIFLVHFQMCIQSCKHHPNQDIEQFQHCRRCCHVHFTSLLSLPAEVTTAMTSVTKDQLLFLNFTQWNCIVCTFLCLASLAQHDVNEIHPCCVQEQFVLFFLLLCVYSLCDHISKIVFLNLTLQLSNYLVKNTDSPP